MDRNPRSSDFILHHDSCSCWKFPCCCRRLPPTGAASNGNTHFYRQFKPHGYFCRAFVHAFFHYNSRDAEMDFQQLAVPTKRLLKRVLPPDLYTNADGNKYTQVYRGSTTNEEKDLHKKEDYLCGGLGLVSSLCYCSYAHSGMEQLRIYPRENAMFCQSAS